MAIPHTFIQDILARADIVDVIGRYMTLKKAGVNFKGLCPFHGEKTPSFIVNPVRQTYHCFGCGVHGDAIRFLMEHNGLSFVEAVKDLAQQLGLQVPEENVSPQQKAAAEHRKAKQLQLTDVLARAAKHWQVALLKSHKAVDYVKRRGLSKDIVTRFAMGYAPPGWQDLAGVFTNYEDPLLVESGLVITHEADSGGAEGKRYDRFRDRLMFPIRNVKGEVIGFGGRILDKGEPKYLNSPETPIFQKGHELYGLYEARSDIRQYGYLLVTEGYMDVVALAQHGFTNAVATLGTACTEDHLHKLFKFTDSVVFSFDGDAAGRRAARRALEIALPFAKDTRAIKFLFLPPEHDPDSYIRELGHDAFAQCVGQAMPLSRFFLEAVREGCDLSAPEGRARMLAQAYPLWSRFPQEALSLQLLAEVAAAGQVSIENLQALWAQQSERSQRGERSSRSGGGDAPSPTPYDHLNGISDAPLPHGSYSFSGGGNIVPGYSNKRYGSNKGNGSYWRKSRQPAMPVLPARAPLTPVERCIRILLIHSDWWEKLPSADQELLCDQPGWQGELFKWLERLIVDRGTVNWAALAQMARSEHWYDMMMSLMDSIALEEDIQFTELAGYLEKIRSAKMREESARILQQFKQTR